MPCFSEKAGSNPISSRNSELANGSRNSVNRPQGAATRHQFDIRPRHGIGNHRGDIRKPEINPRPQVIHRRARFIGGGRRQQTIGYVLNERETDRKIRPALPEYAPGYFRGEARIPEAREWDPEWDCRQRSADHRPRRS